MSVIDEFPFPFEKPQAQQLWRTIAGMYPDPRDATAFARRFKVDPLDLPQGLSPRQLWYVILEKTAIKKTTRAMAVAARDENEGSDGAAFLTSLIDDQPMPVSPEPMKGFDPGLSKPETLLFTDDLTMAAGEVPNLIATLQTLSSLAPSVCLLQVTNVIGEFFGTGFRIGPEHVLTNEHVLFPEHQKATRVLAKFGFDVDAAGADVGVTTLPGDPETIAGIAADDWAVIRVPGMDPSWPVIDLANARVPAQGDRAYILQHPSGGRKRLGFVRNLITEVTDQYVQYLTDTQPGSSGAPVFDTAGKLIALHHRGGTPTQLTGKAPLSKNQGIRISRVHSGLKAKSLVA